MNRQRFLMLTSGLAIVLAMASVAAAERRVAGSSPEINPANFVDKVDNRYFPLRPGTTFFYEGKKDSVPTSDVVHVTHDTKKILGVKCIVVHHESYEDGALVEDTLDYYEQLPENLR